MAHPTEGIAGVSSDMLPKIKGNSVVNTPPLELLSSSPTHQNSNFTFDQQKESHMKRKHHLSLNMSSQFSNCNSDYVGYQKKLDHVFS